MTKERCDSLIQQIDQDEINLKRINNPFAKVGFGLSVIGKTLKKVHSDLLTEDLNTEETKTVLEHLTDTFSITQ